MPLKRNEAVKHQYAALQEDARFKLGVSSQPGVFEISERGAATSLQQGYNGTEY